MRVVLGLPQTLHPFPISPSGRLKSSTKALWASTELLHTRIVKTKYDRSNHVNLVEGPSSGASRLLLPDGEERLLENGDHVENQILSVVEENHRTADENTFSAFRQWRQYYFECGRQRLNFFLKARRQLAVAYQLSLQPGRKRLSLGQSWRQALQVRRIRKPFANDALIMASN